MVRMKFTDEQLKKLMDEGLSHTDIAEKLGVSISTVSLRAKKIGGKVDKFDLIMRYLEKRPSTYNEIARGLEFTYESVFHSLRCMRRSGDVRAVNMNLSSGGHSSTFKSFYLLGDLLGLTICYLPGQEDLLGAKIASYIPQGISKYEKKSLTQKLRRFLPKQAAETVRDYMNQSSELARSK
jgi:transcriptional regulator with XRE-family HTH domain